MDDDGQQVARWFHGFVGSCLADAHRERRVPPVDDDGDYVIGWAGSPVYVSANDAPSPVVRVWAVAASGLRPRLALLRELNDLNADMPLVTVALTPGGAALVSSTLVADAVTPGALRRSVQAVGACAEHVGVLLASAHDGESAFGQTSVDAESA